MPWPQQKEIDIDVPTNPAVSTLQHDFILLDRSGSMSTNNKMEEAVNGINAYVEKLYKDKIDTSVTVAVFDKFGVGADLFGASFNYNVIRDNVAPGSWWNISKGEVLPRGWTPLNDAIGRLVAGAEGGKYEKVVIIIVTDGEENASTQVTGAQAKSMLDNCRQRGWQVLFLGADYENMAQAESLGSPRGTYLSVTPQNFASTMTRTAEKRGLYGSRGEPLLYSDDDAEEAAKK